MIEQRTNWKAGQGLYVRVERLKDMVTFGPLSFLKAPSDPHVAHGVTSSEDAKLPCYREPLNLPKAGD